MTDPSVPARRTKRRFAHELYPHGEEGEPRPLAVEVPYLIARAIGLGPDREWHDLLTTRDPEKARLAASRTGHYIESATIALLAAALHNGLTGQDAWDYVASLTGDVIGEFLYDHALQVGVDPDQIKPYQILSEPDTHQHYSERQGGVRFLLEHRVPGRESDCEQCTEPVEQATP